MHTIKLLLTSYLNISVQAANLSDCRIESNRNFFARIGMLYRVLVLPPRSASSGVAAPAGASARVVSATNCRGAGQMLALLQLRRRQDD